MKIFGLNGAKVQRKRGGAVTKVALHFGDNTQHVTQIISRFLSSQTQFNYSLFQNC